SARDHVCCERGVLGHLSGVERRRVEVARERGEREGGGGAVRDQEEESLEGDWADASLLAEVLEQQSERRQRRCDVALVDVVESLALDASLDVHKPEQLGALGVVVHETPDRVVELIERVGERWVESGRELCDLLAERVIDSCVPETKL